MEKGKDKAARALFEIEPTALIELYRVYPDVEKKPESYFNIHNGSVFGGGVIWQGETYAPIPMETEGFSVSASKVNRPLIRISNKDFFVTSLIKNNNDFANARVERRKTFVKFLDDENFDGGNPFGESDSTANISVDFYLVSQKRQENKVFVELELTSPLDIETLELNNRRILGKYCYWKYRGPGCEYQGIPIERDDSREFTNTDGSPLSVAGKQKTKNLGRSFHKMTNFNYNNPNDLYSLDSFYYRGSVVFKVNQKVRIQDPRDPESFRPLLTYYVARKFVPRGIDPESYPEYWERDGCGKKIAQCKKRFTKEELVNSFSFSEIYQQQFWNILEASKLHMTYLRAKNNGNSWNKKILKALSLNSESFGAGSDCNRKGNDSALKKQFTLSIHIAETFGRQTESAGNNEQNNGPPVINLFKTSNRTDGLKYFEIGMSRERGAIVLLTSVRSPGGGCKLVQSTIELIPNVRLLNENVDLFHCQDLLLTISKRTVNGSFVIETQLSGINKGEDQGGIGTNRFFELENNITLENIDTTGTDRIVMFGGASRRYLKGSEYIYDWTHSKMNVATVAFWDTYISKYTFSDMLGERIYSDQLSSKIIKKWDTIKGFVDKDGYHPIQSCISFWQKPYLNGGNWYVKEHRRGNDLLLRGKDKGFAANSRTFNYWPSSQVYSPGYDFLGDLTEIEANTKSSIQRLEDVGTMPFGGFPGTDGYSYTT
jgi:lambda family phage minor tail protein L